ncbi:hypothetical protein MEG05_20540 [Vibrio aestuarianus]|uniref:hypothetical protein n=1 Tax=Vibrio aestuarianus TaxID=28171 RepID=UPI00237C94B9|nr:hypothetical protein [Vibrio aestuarianus]MDE1316328.1 hypothetical protein [Vibrio aestuarianus]
MNETLCPHCPAVIKESDTTCPSCGLAVVGKPTLSAKELFKVLYREARMVYSKHDEFMKSIKYGEVARAEAAVFNIQNSGISSFYVSYVRMITADIAADRFDEIPF